MTLENLSLARQVDVALQKLEAELKGMTAGTIVILIREDRVGRFGIRHLPLDCGVQSKPSVGMNTAHLKQLRNMAIEALRYKRAWTHGEIAYDFMLRQEKMYVSAQFESNYNMANMMFHVSSKNRNPMDVTRD